MKKRKTFKISFKISEHMKDEKNGILIYDYKNKRVLKW